MQWKMLNTRVCKRKSKEYSCMCLCPSKWGREKEGEEGGEDRHTDR